MERPNYDWNVQNSVFVSFSIFIEFRISLVIVEAKVLTLGEKTALDNFPSLGVGWGGGG